MSLGPSKPRSIETHCSSSKLSGARVRSTGQSVVMVRVVIRFGAVHFSALQRLTCRPAWSLFKRSPQQRADNRSTTGRNAFRDVGQNVRKRYIAARTDTSSTIDLL